MQIPVGTIAILVTFALICIAHKDKSTDLAESAISGPLSSSDEHASSVISSLDNDVASKIHRSIKSGFSGASKTLNRPSFLISSTENCYHIDELIAEGSQAKVYRGIPCRSELPVAIKSMKRFDECTEAESKFFQRFGNAQRYRGVPRLFDLIQTRRRLHIAMQYFEGTPLTDWKITSRREMSDSDFKLYEARIMMVLYKVVAVLNMVHQAGQIHLDLKPRNILVDDYGNIMVLDFGGLKMKSRDRCCIKHVSKKYMFTRGYQAPELEKSRKAGYASDIYSLGCSGQRLVRRLSDSISELLPRLHALISITTQNDPKARPTAKQLLSHDVFKRERHAFFQPGDNVTSLKYLEKVVELRGPNRFYFDALPIIRTNHLSYKP